MRIALLVHDYDRRVGHGRYVVELAERFSREHEVHVFAHRVAEMGDGRIRFHHVPALRATAMTTILTFPFGSWWRVREAFDIVHGQGLCAFSLDVATAHICQWAWFEALRARDGRLTGRDRLFRLFVGRWERALYQPARARWVIAVSEKVRAELARYYGREARVAVVRPGVDLARFHPARRLQSRAAVRRALGYAERDFLLLYVGSLRKGAAEALRALALLSDAQLLLISGSSARPYWDLARRLGLGERVRFRPPTDRIEDYYAASDALLFPTVYDAHGMVIWEAMASGLPVITTRAAGAAEVITHLEDGLLVDDPRDVRALADCARRLREDVAWREAMGQRARARVEAFSWDRAAHETLRVYEWAMRA